MAQSFVKKIDVWKQGAEQGKCNTQEAEVKDFQKKGVNHTRHMA